MHQMWDTAGEAGAALKAVVEGFGVPVLGRPDMLEGLLKDDVPQLPREVAMLTEAARYGLADQLADRVQQGVAAEAAVAMVANEMTSRTAVDAAGALWAAGVIARVIGYQVADPPPAPSLQSQETVLPTPVPVPPGQPLRPTDPIPTRLAEDAAPVTNRLDARQGFDGETIRADGVAIPPRGGYVQTGPPVYPIAPSGQQLGVPTALATGLMLLMLLFWVLSAITHADTVKAWTSLLPLAAGGAAITIWTARGQPGGASFGAVLGLAVPAVSFAIYDAVIAAELTVLSSAKRHVIEATSIVAVLAGITAACIAVVALRRWRQLGRQRPDGLSIVVSIVAVCFAFASIFGQLKTPDGLLFGNVLGSGIRGWFILWGLVFLVAFVLPPLVAALLPPGSLAQLGTWSGWLLIVLAWQISDSPTDGARAAYGLYLTWFVWLLVALGTVALAFRGPASTGGRA